MSYNIAPLGPEHDRSEFCCGNVIIDKFCCERAASDHDRYKVRVRVACPDGANEVAGFYSLVMSTIEPKRILNLPKFGKRPIPAVYLAMLGVTQGHAGQGLGKALMFDAFRRTLAVADNAGAYCLWLQAVDEPTVAYYAALQFERIEPGSLDMYIALDTIRDMVQALDAADRDISQVANEDDEAAQDSAAAS